MTSLEKDRYSRQMLLPQLGKAGQKKLSVSRVLIAGCGATGGNAAMHLVRAGIGHITLLDRDVIEPSNLHRQILYKEKDIGSPKAYVAAERLKEFNSTVDIEGLAEDLSPSNVERFVKSVDIIIDGTDNLETRYILNDACVKLGKPWVYVGAVGTYGMRAFIQPGKTACFRCILPGMPRPGTVPTCATVGVLNTIPAIMGAMGATEAIRFIVGGKPTGNLVVYDVWGEEHRTIALARRKDCPCCVKRKFEYLDVPLTTKAQVMCGTDSVQLTPAREASLELEKMAGTLKEAGEVEAHPLWLIFKDGKHRLTIFKNGRVLIYGTNDEKVARALYSKYIGN